MTSFIALLLSAGVNCGRHKLGKTPRGKVPDKALSRHKLFHAEVDNRLVIAFLDLAKQDAISWELEAIGREFL